MPDIYIIAEAAQGYLPLEGEVGSSDTALLLVKAASAAGADAVKFQIVYAEELAQSGNVHYDIFRRLEMERDDWARVRRYARDLGIAFVADVFGNRSLDVARTVEVDGVKLHSTTFFEHDLVDQALALGCPAFLSAGGIELDELRDFIVRHEVKDRGEVTLLYGFQAEPTVTEQNNLSRIPALRELTGLSVGFMDHADGAGPDWVNLSVLAYGLGVRVFEKHLTLDRELELEDFVSAVAPGRFHEYVSTLRRLGAALGRPDLELTEPERDYRQKALKRVTASRDLEAGHLVSSDDILLIRPAAPRGAFDPTSVVGRTLRRAIAIGDPINVDDIG
jgi:N,N'-diacetyllegionaminate synthase